MASSKILRETVGEVTECPICRDTTVDPRVLPCIHMFCFKCLDQLWKDKQPGVKVPCPLCRTEIILPVGGVSGLPKNFFVEKLVKAQNMSETENKLVLCDICSTNDRAGDRKFSSNKFCFECQHHLCNTCLKVHSSMKATKTHQIISTGGKSAATMELIRFPESYCASHEDQKIQIYCVECKIALCTICFITKHKRHEGSDIQSVAGNFKIQIESNIERSLHILAGLDDQLQALEERLVNFDHNVRETESRIVQTGEHMMQLINKHVQALLHELEDERLTKIREFEVVKEELLVQKLSLESFIKYSEKIVEKAVPADVANVAEDLLITFERLKNEKVLQIEKSLEISFIPRDSQFGNDKNVVGKIEVHENLFSTSGRSVDPNLCSSIKFSDCVRGIATSSDNLFVIIGHSNVVHVFNLSTLAQEPTIPVLGLSDPYDIAGSGNVLYIGSENGKIYRIELRNKTITSWSVGSGDGLVSLSINRHGHVIVANQASNKLYEYTSTGELRREIALKGDVVHPYRAVHINGDQFLVCQAEINNLHRVCLIDNRGNLIKSYGSTKGSGNANLWFPYRLVVDRNGFILIADYSNKRVVLLNKNLEYVKDIIPTSFKLSRIFTLFLDENNKRLYVSDFDNKKLLEFDFETRN